MKRLARSPLNWAWAICLPCLALTASAQSTKPESKAESVIEALLKAPAPPPDWREHLKKRKETPPAKPRADAAIAELKNYWRTAPETEAPDEKTRAQLLEACEAAPEEIAGLLPRLALDSPDVQDRLKKLYDRLVAQRRQEDAPRAEMIRDALMTHSRYFRDELIRRVFFPDNVNERDFLEATSAFLRLDREGAKQLFLKESTSDDLMHRVLALTNLRAHFTAEAEARTATDWLNELKRIARDPKSARQPRGLALASVMSGQTPENDEWFLEMFRDRTLQELEQYSSHTTLLADVVAERPDYWIPKIVPLVASKDAAIHTNAILALIQFQIDKARADALRPLLPWLENPRWAPEVDELHGRLRLIQSLDRVSIPEAVPGLLKVVEKASEFELAGAAEALAYHNAREASEPLKRAFKREKEEHHRRTITRALLKLGGLSVEEMVEALRFFAEKMSTADGRKEVEAADDLSPKKQLDPRVSMGRELARSDLSDDHLSAALLAEADRLAPTNAAAADILRQFVARWQTPSALKAIVDRLRTGDFTEDWVRQLVEQRKQLAAPLAEAHDLTGAALGIQAALTADPILINRVLEKQDRFAQLALVAVARLAHVELPITPIASWLASTDQPLARAAELYLEANDSGPARDALWAYSKDKARVLGYPHSSETVWKGDIYRSEAEARDLVLSPNGPRDIYALLSEGTWGGRGQALLLRYDNRLVLRRDDGNGRYQEREVISQEMADLKGWIERERIDDLPPFDKGTADGVQYEYLHVSRAGGRRVYMNNPPGANAAPRVEFGDQQYGPDPAIYGELTDRLARLSAPAMKVRYPALEKIPGFEVVHPGEKGEVIGIQKKDGQLVAWIRLPSEDATAWHRVSASGLSKDFEVKKREEKPADEPDDSRAVQIEEGPLRGKKLLPIWVNKKREDGLWALAKDGTAELIAKGNFSRPVVCPGGEWIVVAKTPPGQSWAPPNGVVRIHLPDKRMIPVDLPPAENFDPLAWIAPHQRVLLYRQRNDPRFLPPRDKPDPNAGPENPEFYLLEPGTGKLERVEGDFRPLERLEGHDLQPTANSDEFWAVIVEKPDGPRPTAVLGKYSTKNFRFSESVRFPEMWFQSWDCVIDQPNHCAWVAVNGDLLRVHLPETDQDSSPPKSK